MPGGYRQQYDYRTVMDAALSEMNITKKEQILLAAGGVNISGAATVICPVPVFWSKLINNDLLKYVPPFATGLVNGVIELRLTLRAGADFTSGTVGALTRIELVSEVVETDEIEWNALTALRDAGKYIYPSYTWRVRESGDNTAASGAATDIKMNFLTGLDVHSLYICAKKTSSLTSGEYYLNQDIDSFEFEMDSQRVWDLRYAEVSKYNELIQNKSRDTTLGNPTTIQFALDSRHGGSDWSGGLIVTGNDNLLLKNLTQSSGSTCQIDMAARCYSHVWIKQNGSVKEVNKF